MIYTDKIYGKAEIEGLIAELIETKTFQRLKRIHQGGAIIIANPDGGYNMRDKRPPAHTHTIGGNFLIAQTTSLGFIKR